MNNELDNFLTKHNWALLERLKGWVVDRSSDNCDVVRLSVSARDGERYIARCECQGYPIQPPSVVFVNDRGSKTDPKAWPAGDAEFNQIIKPPPNCFLCTSLTREGLDHHKEWKNDRTKNPWSSEKHTLLDIFNLVSRLLSDSHYTGRTP
jgi:hypothetical protein